MLIPPSSLLEGATILSGELIELNHRWLFIEVEGCWDATADLLGTPLVSP